MLVGIAALVLPGPGLLALFAGVALLATQYEWAERRLEPVKKAALRGAADSVKTSGPHRRRLGIGGSSGRAVRRSAVVAGAIAADRCAVAWSAPIDAPAGWLARRTGPPASTLIGSGLLGSHAIVIV